MRHLPRLQGTRPPRHVARDGARSGVERQGQRGRQQRDHVRGDSAESFAHGRRAGRAEIRQVAGRYVVIGFRPYQAFEGAQGATASRPRRRRG